MQLITQHEQPPKNYTFHYGIRVNKQDVQVQKRQQNIQITLPTQVYLLSQAQIQSLNLNHTNSNKPLIDKIPVQVTSMIKTQIFDIYRKKLEELKQIEKIKKQQQEQAERARIAQEELKRQQEQRKKQQEEEKKKKQIEQKQMKGQQTPQLKQPQQRQTQAAQDSNPPVSHHQDIFKVKNQVSNKRYEGVSNNIFSSNNRSSDNIFASSSNNNPDNHNRNNFSLTNNVVKQGNQKTFINSFLARPQNQQPSNLFGSQHQGQQSNEPVGQHRRVNNKPKLANRRNMPERIY